MTTNTYPALASANIQDLEPGEWAFASGPSADAPYGLIMKTDEPCTSADRVARWVLHIGKGSASFVSSSAFNEPIVRIDGDIRIPVSISKDQPITAGEYKPGLLYVGISKAALLLIAQCDRQRSASAVAITGSDMILEGLDRIDFWQSERIEYRAPGDFEWCELARINQPL